MCPEVICPVAICPEAICPQARCPKIICPEATCPEAICPQPIPCESQCESPIPEKTKEELIKENCDANDNEEKHGFIEETESIDFKERDFEDLRNSYRRLTVVDV